MREKFRSSFPPEFLARHPSDPFAIDTLDGNFYNGHLNGHVWMFRHLSPVTAVREFNYARQSTPFNDRLLRRDMVRFIDRLSRKTLVFSSNGDRRVGGADGDARRRQPRLLIKGHFLSIGDALADKYPGARFLTILQDPCARLRSGINYMAVNPSLYPNRAEVPWPLLAGALQESEAQYCHRELEWFRGGSGSGDGEDGEDESDDVDGENKLAVTFDSFVRNRETTVAGVMRWLGWDPEDFSSGAPAAKAGVENGNARKHRASSSPRKAARSSASPRYQVDRSLPELGIDEEAYRKRLANYLSWMEEVQGRHL